MSMGNFFHSIYLNTDIFLIFFYRMTDLPIANFLIGTFSLSFLCVIIGEISVSLAIKFNKRYVDQMTAEGTGERAVVHCGLPSR